MQLVGLLLAFVVILILVGRHVRLGLCLLAGAAVLALASLMSPRDVALAVYHGLTKVEAVELMLDVAVITSLAGILKRFGLMDTMVRSLTVLVGGARLAIMAVPSLIGALSVVGGAALSAPMVDGLGDDLGLGPARKAAVNLFFRHAWFYVAPFAPSLVLASKVSGLPLGRLALQQVPFAVVMLVGGYALFLARAGRSSGPGASGRGAAPAEPAASRDDEGPDYPQGPREAAWPFLRSASPIIVGVILSLEPAGLKLPLYGGIGAGLALALLLSRRHPRCRLWGLPAAWAEIQWNLVLTMGAIMIFGQVLTDSGSSQALVAWLVASGLPAWVMMVVLPATVGYISGVPSIPVGVSFPVLMPLALPGHALGTATVLYSSSFIAYYVSPLHLCQVLTSQYFGVTIPRLYREYWPVVLALVALTGVYVRFAL